jgi:hypothetical protein
MALTADDFAELYDRHGRALVIFFRALRAHGALP